MKIRTRVLIASSVVAALGLAGVATGNITAVKEQPVEPLMVDSIRVDEGGPGMTDTSADRLPLTMTPGSIAMLALAGIVGITRQRKP